MGKTDTVLIRPADVTVALCLLTRLSLPDLPASAFDRQAQASWAFPLVGLIVGGVATGAAWLAMTVGLGPALAGGVALAVQILLTGAMHEDGLADTADGFWGGLNRDQRLEIMADSTIGTYGVLALILSVGLRWLALTAILTISLWPIVAIAILSRTGLPALMHALPRARPGGLSDGVGKPPRQTCFLAALVGVVCAAILIGTLVLPVFLACIAALVATALIARAKIGGQTGDVLGSAQQLGELAALLTLATLIT